MPTERVLKTLMEVLASLRILEKKYTGKSREGRSAQYDSFRVILVNRIFIDIFSLSTFIS